MSAPAYVSALLAGQYWNSASFGAVTVSFGFANSVPSCFSEPELAPLTSSFVSFNVAQKTAARSALALSPWATDGTAVIGGGSLGMKPAGWGLVTPGQFVA